MKQNFKEKIKKVKEYFSNNKVFSMKMFLYSILITVSILFLTFICSIPASSLWKDWYFIKSYGAEGWITIWIGIISICVSVYVAYAISKTEKSIDERFRNEEKRLALMNWSKFLNFENIKIRFLQTGKFNDIELLKKFNLSDDDFVVEISLFAKIIIPIDINYNISSFLIQTTRKRLNGPEKSKEVSWDKFCSLGDNIDANIDAVFDYFIVQESTRLNIFLKCSKLEKDKVKVLTDLVYSNKMVNHIDEFCFKFSGNIINLEEKNDNEKLNKGENNHTVLIKGEVTDNRKANNPSKIKQSKIKPSKKINITLVKGHLD